MRLRVIKPGLLTTVQDLGRRGRQHLGVVTGGAMDTVSARLANALVGNDAGAAVLEITLLGPELLFECAALVALCGAEFEAGIPSQRPVLVPRGMRLRFGPARGGARACLAVAGGIAVPEVLGSRSTYLPAVFGGHEGRALRAGDALPLAGTVEALSRERAARLRRLRDAGEGMRSTPWRLPGLVPGGELTVRVLPGHHAELFDAASLREFHAAPWRLLPDSNRMGFRFAGPGLARGGGDVLTEPACLGSVQVPPSGQPIVLMADHQTTGGYPKIAEVITADIPTLAQAAPGGLVRFTRCSYEDALAALARAEQRVKAIMAAVQWETA